MLKFLIEQSDISMYFTLLYMELLNLGPVVARTSPCSNFTSKLKVSGVQCLGFLYNRYMFRHVEVNAFIIVSLWRVHKLHDPLADQQRVHLLRLPPVFQTLYLTPLHHIAVL